MYHSVKCLMRGGGERWRSAARMKTDVAIVGAGPAGAWGAFTLARRGARVSIIDATHPREKPCGGGVTGRALRLVADAIDPRRFQSTHIRTARFVDSSAGTSATVALCDESHHSDPDLVVASRTELDGQLLMAAREAGAELVPARVVDVVAERG